MKRYKVLLPIEVNGRIYQHGEMVELEENAAKLYSHALIAQTEEGANHVDGTNG